MRINELIWVRWQAKFLKIGNLKIAPPGQRTLRQQERLKIDFREILRVVRFSASATISATSVPLDPSHSPCPVESKSYLSSCAWPRSFRLACRPKVRCGHEAPAKCRVRAVAKKDWCPFPQRGLEAQGVIPGRVEKSEPGVQGFPTRGSPRRGADGIRRLDTSCRPIRPIR